MKLQHINNEFQNLMDSHTWEPQAIIFTKNKCKLCGIECEFINNNPQQKGFIFSYVEEFGYMLSCQAYLMKQIMT